MFSLRKYQQLYRQILVQACLKKLNQHDYLTGIEFRTPVLVIDGQLAVARGQLYDTHLPSYATHR